jgi:hypothetical protein
MILKNIFHVDSGTGSAFISLFLFRNGVFFIIMSNITACAYSQHLYSGITCAKRYRLRLLAPAIHADPPLKVGITNLFFGQKRYRYRYAIAFLIRV